jgi:hypothetical protein
MASLFNSFCRWQNTSCPVQTCLECHSVLRAPGLILHLDDARTWSSQHTAYPPASFKCSYTKTRSQNNYSFSLFLNCCMVVCYWTAFLLRFCSLWGAGDQTSNLAVVGRAAQPPEPHAARVTRLYHMNAYDHSLAGGHHNQWSHASFREDSPDVNPKHYAWIRHVRLCTRGD